MNTLKFRELTKEQERKLEDFQHAYEDQLMDFWSEYVDKYYPYLLDDDRCDFWNEVDYDEMCVGIMRVLGML